MRLAKPWGVGRLLTDEFNDGVASDGGAQRRTMFPKGVLRISALGAGVAVAMAATIGAIVALPHADPSDAVLSRGASTSTNIVARAETPFDGGRQDIVAAVKSMAEQGDRLIAHYAAIGHSASIDLRRIAWQPSSFGSMDSNGLARLALALSRFPVAGTGEDMLPPGLTAYGAEKADRLTSDRPSDGRVALPRAPAQALASIADLARIADRRVREAAYPADTADAASLMPKLASLEPSRGAAEALRQMAEARAANDAGQQDTAVASDDALLPEDVPLPVARPSDAPAGKPDRVSPPVQLAYAAPNTDDDTSGGLRSLFRPKPRLPGRGSGIAVYDIEKATVYLPDGSKLEAHSGLREMRDDPRFVDRKMRGPTPPNVYDLVLRERRFHGVEAVRLLPADGHNKFGRNGLLAHTYMYRGPGGRDQSNGCVVMRDYPAFLRAFKQGKISKMIVVPSIDDLPTYMASL